MNAAPRLSVVMPTRDDESFLPAALESVLAQTYGDFELLIVDGAAGCATRDILAHCARKDARVNVQRNETQQGVARSLNRGIVRARGEYVARVDSDDIALPARFAAQVEYLDRHPEIGVLGTQAELIDRADMPCAEAVWQVPLTHNAIAWQLLCATPFCHPSTVMRTACLRALRGYDPAYPNEDMHLWTRAVFTTRLANLSEPLLRYRTLPGEQARRLQFWEPHIRRVGGEYLARILQQPVDARLLEILVHFQHPDELLGDATLESVLALCLTLEEAFAAMREQGLLDAHTSDEAAQVLDRQVQRLVSLAIAGVPISKWSVPACG